MKYELIIEHEGSRDSVIDFANEVNAEFGVEVTVNGLDRDGNVVEPLIDWKSDKWQTTDKPG